MTGEQHHTEITEKIKKEIKKIDNKIKGEKKERLKYLVLTIPVFILLLAGAIYLGGTLEKANEKEISLLSEKCANAAKEKNYKFYSLIATPKQKINHGNCAMSDTKDGKEITIVRIPSDQKTSGFIQFKPVPN